MNPWVILAAAGLFETAWSIGLKYSQGFTKPLPSVFTLITLAVSMVLLAKAATQLPIGTAYGVWVGIGTIGTVILGVFLFQESLSPARIGFLILLVISLMGLKLAQSS